MKKKLLLFFVSLLSLTSVAQDTEFWFAGPVSLGVGLADMYMGGAGFVFSNPTHRHATVRIEYYKDNSDTTITIPAYSYNYMFYPNEQDVKDKIEDFYGPVGVPRSTGIHITSNVAISGYYIYDRQHQQETFLLKGKASLGTDFYAPTGISGSILSTDGGIYLGGGSTPYISVAGTENGTTVSFNLKSAVTGFPAGPGSVTLNKGEVITFRSTGGNLAGSHIYSDKPITVTAGEECRNSNGGACDHVADQLVTNSFAGGVYVMPLSAGYMPSSFTTWIQNYFEIVAIEPNTNVSIDWGSGPVPLTTLVNAGDTYISDPISVYTANACATISSDKPIHVMQNTGHEATLCHLPNFYATNTHKTSFYSYWGNFPGTDIYPGVSLVYNSNSKDDFTISYPGQPETPLFDWITANARQIDGQGNVPGFTGWEYIRFTLPAAATNQIITINNSTSVFQLGFSSSFPYGTNMNYLTAFNSDFSFDPDTIWTCPGIHTNLIGGIASYYKWTLPDGSIREGSDLNTIKALQMGMYILEMTQGFNTVTDTCWVNSINFSKNGTIGKSLTKPFKVGRPQQFLPSIDVEAAQHMTEFRWTFQGGTPATSTAADPMVTFNSTGVKEVTLYMKYETVYPDSTVAVCDSFLVVRVPVQAPSVDYYVDPDAPNKVGVNDDAKSDEELFYEGQSIEDPFNLEDALKQASQGDIIHVPPGEYTPVNGPSFVIDCDSVTLIGVDLNAPEDSAQARPSVETTVIRGKGEGSAIVVELGPATGACGITTATRIEGFAIEGGRAENGGGIAFLGGASGTVANCIIRDNVATENGGGVYTTPYRGCGTSADPIFQNVEISGNIAKRGGGMYNDTSRVTLINVTIGGNVASLSAGGMYNYEASPLIRNSIVYGNATAGKQLENEFVADGGIPHIAYSNISGSNGSGANWNSAYGTDGSHNIDKGPLYKTSGFDPHTGAMRRGNYRIGFDSPSCNRGYNGYVIDVIFKDLNGYSRILYDFVDMGAYEYAEMGDPVINHYIKIPLLANAVSEPPAGIFYAVGHSDFTIVFTPKAGYSLADMKVTTGSVWQDEMGGMQIIHNEDGSVTVTLRRITEHLTLEISGVGPVSTEMIDNVYALWGNAGRLHVKTSKAGLLKVYGMTGGLIKQLRVTEGDNTLPLEAGVYIVTLNDGHEQKVVIK